jgi:2-iminobutanoate/2-iminopropanoate deaminase
MPCSVRSGLHEALLFKALKETLMIEYPLDPGTPKSHLPFSPAVRVGSLIFVSGQASVDATGQIVVDSFEGEMRRSMENLAKILATAGSDMAHVIQTRNYVRDVERLPEFNALYREFFSAPYPARTTLTSCLSPALQYEIEAVAVVRKS